MCSKGGEQNEKIWKRIFSLEHFILCPSVIMEERRRLHFSFKFFFFLFLWLIVIAFRFNQFVVFNRIDYWLCFAALHSRTTATLPQQKKETKQGKEEEEVNCVSCCWRGGRMDDEESLGRWQKISFSFKVCLVKLQLCSRRFRSSAIVLSCIREHLIFFEHI